MCVCFPLKPPQSVFLWLNQQSDDRLTWYGSAREGQGTAPLPLPGPWSP